MAPKGFIQDKLEIKFLILYLAARVIEPVPFDTMLDLTLCDDAIDYFDFSDCLGQKVVLAFRNDLAEKWNSCRKDYTEGKSCAEC